jgi:hypothetical protein
VNRIAYLRVSLCASVFACLGWAIPASAVIVLGGRDATGTLNNSGQNLNAAPSNLGGFVGTFGDFLGTPIAPDYFITANHIGNAGGGTFTYNDGGATPIAYGVTLAGTQDDLAIWKITTGPAFTHYAPIYTGSNETGLSLISLGRGTPRGSVVDTPGTSTPAGWNWGTANPLHPVTWGANTVAGIVTPSNPPPGLGGDFLQFAFNNNGNPDTGILSVGDSGGPTFVFNPATNEYELAGINSTVDEYSTQSDPNGSFLLPAALYDVRGFYDGTTLQQGANPIPENSYSTRISSRLSFIESVAGVPEPGVAILLLGMTAAFGRRHR